MLGTKEIFLSNIGVEAVKVDKNFFKSMKDGESKAIILKNNVVVVVSKERSIGEGKVITEMTCFPSICLDANLSEKDIANEANNYEN